MPRQPKIWLTIAMAALCVAATTSVRIATELPITGGPFLASAAIGCPTCAIGATGSIPEGIVTYADSSGKQLDSKQLLVTKEILNPGDDFKLPTEKAVRTLFATLPQVNPPPGGGGGSAGGLCNVSLAAAMVFDASQCSVFTVALGPGAEVQTTSLTNVQPGQAITFFVTQDFVGGHAFPWPPNVVQPCAVDQGASITTAVLAINNSGQNVFAMMCVTNRIPTVFSGPARDTPGTPPSGVVTCWLADTGAGTGTFRCQDKTGLPREMARYADAETPVGAIDGTNATFSLQRAPNPPESLVLTKNGLMMKAGLDYTLTAATIVFSADAIPTAPPARAAPVPKAAGAPGPDVLLAYYRF